MTEPIQFSYADQLNDMIAAQAQMCFAPTLARYGIEGDLPAFFMALAAGQCPVWERVNFSVSKAGLVLMAADYEILHPKACKATLWAIDEFASAASVEGLTAAFIQKLMGEPVLSFKNALAASIGSLYAASLNLSSRNSFEKVVCALSEENELTRYTYQLTQSSEIPE